MHDENDKHKHLSDLFFAAMNEDGTYSELKPINGEIQPISVPQPLVFRGLDGLYIVDDKLFEEE